jgi:hypothetical protein
VDLRTGLVALLLYCNLHIGPYLPSIIQHDFLSFLRAATCSDHFNVLRTRNVTVIRVAFRRFRVQAGARTPATLTWNIRVIRRSIQANADMSRNTPRPLPFIYFPNYYSLIILPFDDR